MSVISITVADQVYAAEPTLDVDGDGQPDGVLVDFDGDGTADDIAWDSDGDGVIDTILVASNNDGNFDTGYYDPSGHGEWNEVGTRTRWPDPRPDRPRRFVRRERRGDHPGAGGPRPGPGLRLR